MSRKKPIADIYPLSPLQQGILYHTLEHREPSMYLSQVVYEIAGTTDVSALRQAAERVVARHTALRTAIAWEKRETPLQVVLSDVRLPWQEHDWRNLDEQQSSERLAAFLAEDRARGFDLSKAPLLRVTVFQIAGGRLLLVWSTHHILLDGWSVVILLGETASFYEELTAGRLTPLPPARPFGDYISWLQGRGLAEAEQYWRRTLAGFHTPTPVPLERRVRSRSDGEESYPQLNHFLPGDLTLALQAFARRHQLTLSTVVQGGWAVLLARHGGTDDVLFGVTVTGRPPELSGVEDMIGLFINTLPLRVRLRPQDRSIDWLRRLQEQQLKAGRHDHAPLPEVHGWSEVARGTPLFETFVNYQSYAWERAGQDASLAGLQVVGSRSVIQANYPVSLGVSADREIDLRISFDALRFDESSVRRVQGQLQALLAGFVEAGGPTLSDLSLLGAAEKRQILDQWSSSRKLWPAASVPELFEQVVDAAPDAPAVVCGETSLTYRELDRRSNQLACYLRRLDVGAGSLVALCLDRSWQAIVALLAVLKAGGAYVALEPSDPEERLGSLIREAGIPLIVTRGRATLATLSGSLCVDLDVDAGRIAAESPRGLPDRPPPEALAYVLFTSGSTGKPKGVAIEHRQLVQYVASIQEALELAPGMTYALVSTLAADLGHTCLYPALLSGGCLHVASREQAMDPVALAGLFRGQRIDCLKIVPSHLGALLQAPCAADLLPAARLIVGGEASTWEDCDRLRALGLRCRVFNHYGPTETTVGVAAFELPKEAAGDRFGPTVPLGRPLAHARLYVLDLHGQPAPAGLPGELLIGGASLARGYLRDPAATAERFVPDPLAGGPGERLYRTGDRARWLPDGTLEFLGRIDHQVKIRGFRVELGEIEAMLKTHPTVGEAVAAVRGEGEEARIVAYVTEQAAAARPAHAAPYRLPNGMDLFHHNEHETKALFEEIFVKRSYLRHGVGLPARGCVIDVGANIGVFSLFVHHLCPEIPIYAFEPAQPVFEILRCNAERHGRRIKAFDCGLADREKVEDFTYYPFYSTQSGLAALANSEEDARVVGTVLRNAGTGLEVEAEELALGFAAERLSCRFARLSEILRREDIHRVGLLKIDVQRAELEVLSGIDEGDWPKIDQVVVEVHDRIATLEEGRVERVVSLLRDRGFATVVEQDELLQATDRYNVYAVREQGTADAPELPQPAAAVAAPAPAPMAGIAGLLASFLAKRLPGHMVPSAIVALDRLPLTPNGKVDRRSLPDPDAQAPPAAKILPRNPLEAELAAVWSEILGSPVIGVEDDFFALGGHSLRAMQLITRLRRRLQVELSLREFLGAPTVAGLALLIVQKRAEQAPSEEVLRILEELEDIPPRDLAPPQSGLRFSDL
jgi:amino acid adenylation domain-containing protein/FkbM family methyltransferase